MSYSEQSKRSRLWQLLVRNRAWLLLWAVCYGAFIFAARENIAHLRMGDPDDELRLVQIRDWMAGQSWFDVTQYRMNLPDGGPMHWSRLVDVPVMLCITLLRLFFDPVTAERCALVFIPLVTFAIILAQVNAITARLFDSESGFIAMVITILAGSVMMQIVPMRIDHHGWQMVLFLLCVGQLLHHGSIRAGVIIGMLLAIWLTISIEGLPFAIGFTGILALRWLRDPAPARFTPLCATMLTLALTGWSLLFSTRVYDSHIYCDIFAQGQLIPISAAAIILSVATYAVHIRSVIGQIAIKLCALGLAVMAAAGSLAIIAPQCAGDAFSGLDPLVREYWYLRTSEGLPIWLQDASYHLMLAMFIVQALIAIWFIFHDTRRVEWSLMVEFALLMALTIVTTILVRRTDVYLQLMIAILLAPFIAQFIAKARRENGAGKRMVGYCIALGIIMLPMLAPKAWAALSFTSQHKDAAQHFDLEQIKICQSPKTAQYLNALKTAQIMTSLDMGPRILVHTPHYIVASGHHHNQRAMRDVIMAFTGPASVTKGIFQRRKIQYLVTCGADFEYSFYAAKAPHGFWAQLERGIRPDWLKPPVKYGPLDVWEVSFPPSEKVAPNGR